MMRRSYSMKKSIKLAKLAKSGDKESKPLSITRIKCQL